MSIPALLLSSFVIAVTALVFFIWSLRRGLLDPDPEAAKVIFAEGEIGTVEEPAIGRNDEQGLQRSLHAQKPLPQSLPELQARRAADHRSEEHTSELQSLMRISYAVFCLKKKKQYISTREQTITQ